VNPWQIGLTNAEQVRVPGRWKIEFLSCEQVITTVEFEVVAEDSVR
jgi:hypothetical protein